MMESAEFEASLVHGPPTDAEKAIAMMALKKSPVMSMMGSTERLKAKVEDAPNGSKVTIFVQECYGVWLCEMLVQGAHISHVRGGPDEIDGVIPMEIPARYNINLMDMLDAERFEASIAPSAPTAAQEEIAKKAYKKCQEANSGMAISCSEVRAMVEPGPGTAL